MNNSQTLLDSTFLLKQQLIESGPYTILILPFVNQCETAVRESVFESSRYNPPTFTPKATHAPRTIVQQHPVHRHRIDVNEHNVKLSENFANFLPKNNQVQRSVLSSKPCPLSRKRKIMEDIHIDEVKEMSVEPGEIRALSADKEAAHFRTEASKSVNNLKDREIPKALELYIHGDQAQIIEGCCCLFICIYSYNEISLNGVLIWNIEDRTGDANFECRVCYQPIAEEKDFAKHVKDMHEDLAKVSEQNYF
jgi:hypothetical protein